MGGRTKPTWIVYEGGPLHGVRLIASAMPRAGETFRAYAPSPTPGMRTPVEYLVTAEVRKNDRDGGLRLAPATVARFVRALGDEPRPPTPDVVVVDGGTGRLNLGMTYAAPLDPGYPVRQRPC